MKLKIIYRKQRIVLIMLTLIGISLKGYGQQYLPLTGGTLTGNLILSSGAQVQGSFYGFNATFPQPSNSYNVAVLANGNSNTVDFVGFTNGWRFIPNNQSTYASPVVSIDPSGNTTIAGSTYVAQNLGVGTTTPQAKLDVNGVISMQSFAYLSSQRTNNNNYTNLFLGGALKDNNNGTFTVIGDGGSNYFGAIQMNNLGGNAGAINFYTGASTGGNSYSITSSSLASNLAMTIVGGNVAIGTSNPQGYKLAVNGNAIATAMTVKLYANWPDYVFKKEYHLQPLNQLEAFIDQNHHLPEMPSEHEIAKDGINLGEMDKLLTKKVEELTLYLIEKDKQLTNEREITKQQQQQIDALKEQLKLQDENFKQLKAAVMKLSR